MKLWLIILSLVMFSSANVIFAKQEETSTIPRVVKPQEPVVAGSIPDARKISKITLKLRKELLRDKTLSASAQNINIEVTDSNITLAGEVKSKMEEQKLLKHAARSAPKLKIFNDIKIVE